jgi:small subunit ribosomal protein S6
MSLYEHVFLARQDLSQAQVDALAEAATKIIEEHKGKVIKTETWGLRTLTYKIQKNRKAHFVMLDIDASGDTIAELERQTRMNEDIIRYMTVRVDKHEVGPSVMMRKSDRPERSERGGFGGDRPDRGDRDRGAPRGDRPDRGGFGDRAPRAEQEA